MKSILFFLIFTFSSVVSAFSYPVNFTDARDHQITITQKPARVVSVVPAVTEIIFRIGAGDAVKGLTYHDTYPPETSQKEIVGGFFTPNLKKIEQIQPDIIFISDIQKDLIGRFENKKSHKAACQLISIQSTSVSDIYQNILLLGKIFDKQENAKQLVQEIKKDIQTISQKIEKIPAAERKRIIRLMGRDEIMTPGDDSFQNEYIRLAGGIPPKLGKTGQVVSMTKEEWTAFNPQVIYGCGGDREIEKKFFSQPGWKDVDAVKNGNIFYFPCDLTCRASSRAGYFISCLAARVYEKEFGNKASQVIENQVVKSVPPSAPLTVELDYVKDIQIFHTYNYDFVHKTLVVELKNPMSVVSTLEGYREGIRFVGNSYSPPPVWGIYHQLGLEKSSEDIYKVLDHPKDNASFLFTGADMDNLAIKTKQFKDMKVYALVTAGVKSNAVRMAKDTGKFYEPGTINMILLTNMKLSRRAMTRAIISATEAKTAALDDMDIRSTYTPLIHPATGTGTDNIIVAEGTGVPIHNAGGHSKMGELIARAVYDAVQEAVYKQNGLVGERDIFERLKERKISLFNLIFECECNIDKSGLKRNLENLLLEPAYVSFLESAFAISDDYEQGLIKDLTFFKMWCDQVMENIAGHKVEDTKDFIGSGTLPDTMKMAFNALLNGISGRAD